MSFDVELALDAATLSVAEVEEVALAASGLVPLAELGSPDVSVAPVDDGVTDEPTDVDEVCAAEDVVVCVDAAAS